MLQPMHDWVLLRPIESEKEKKSSSGLILVNDHDTNLPAGQVVATGPGTYDYNGNLHSTNVNVGDIVMYMEQGMNYEDEGEKLYMVHATSIVGKL